VVQVPAADRLHLCPKSTFVLFILALFFIPYSIFIAGPYRTQYVVVAANLKTQVLSHVCYQFPGWSFLLVLLIASMWMLEWYLN